MHEQDGELMDFAMLLRYIERAQREFESTKNQKLLILEFGDDGCPETIRKSDYILVRLNKGLSCIGYTFEAAHEAVHCLESRSYWDRPYVNYLEEGIATDFSLRMVKEEYGKCEFNRMCKDFVTPRYHVARSLVLGIDPNIFNLGRRLLSRTDSFKDISRDDIKELYPQALDQSVTDLLESFPPQ